MKASRQALFDIGLENGIRYFDRKAGLCFYTLNRKPGFQGRAHDDAQSTVLMAGGLLIRDAPGDRALALQILRALTRTEPSWNVGFRLFLLCWIANETAVACRDDAELSQTLRDSILGAASVVVARRPGHVHRPGYTNFWLLDMAGLILAGEYLDKPEIRRRGLAMLREFERLESRFDAPEEFNSPTYLPVQMSALIGLRAFGSDRVVTRRAAHWERWLWRHFDRHYDQTAGILTGPWSRAYEEDRVGQQPLVRLMMAGLRGDASAWKWVMDEVASQPSTLVWGILFSRLHAVSYRRRLTLSPRREVLPPGPVGGRTAVELTICRAGRLRLGSVSRWHLWEQAVPLTIHRDGHAAPIVYHYQATGRAVTTRFLAVQEAGELLAGFSYIVPTRKTNQDMGVTRGATPKPVIVANELRFPLSPQCIRLRVAGKAVAVRNRILPAGEPIVIAGKAWAIGLVVGPISPRTAGPCRLVVRRNEVAIQMTSGSRPSRWEPGMDQPYGWYYLRVVEMRDKSTLGSLMGHMANVVIEDSSRLLRHRLVLSRSRVARLGIRIEPAVGARCWMSNGWAVF